MADITMCSGVGCPRSSGCYRCIAIPNQFMQSYFTGVPNNEDGTCEHFWKAEEHDKRRSNEQKRKRERVKRNDKKSSRRDGRCKNCTCGTD